MNSFENSELYLISEKSSESQSMEAKSHEEPSLNAIAQSI